jgi:hypothetical protein
MTPSLPLTLTLTPQSQSFFVIVTGLVTQLASLVIDPLLAFLLRISMYLSRILVVKHIYAMPH